MVGAGLQPAKVLLNGDAGARIKRATADPWDCVPANRKDKRFNDRGANSQHNRVFSASGFAAGPLRKPGAARLMNWFYELPPYRWFLPFGGSRPTARYSGLQPQYAPARGWLSRSIFGAESGMDDSARQPRRGDRAQIATESPQAPHWTGLQTASSGCRYHQGPCRKDQDGTYGRNGRNVVQMSRHRRTQWNATTN
jgi:hypothetical protein